MLPSMNSYSRFSIYDLRNLCEIIGTNPDGTRPPLNQSRVCGPSSRENPASEKSDGRAHLTGARAESTVG
jgi:hypothetical protein